MLNRAREQISSWKTSIIGLGVILLSAISLLLVFYLIIAALKLLIG